MNRSDLGLSIAAACAALLGPRSACAQARAPRPAEPPNIVLILADDLGWTDLSTGAPNGGHASDYYTTPHLAVLAAAGMSFDHAYACGPNCAPTRAALMSGQYAPRTGVYTVGDGNRGRARHRGLDAAPNRTDLDPAVVTIAETLRARGYATGHFGKWHLGDDADGRGPRAQGFDVNRGGTRAGSVSGGSRGHFAHDDGSFDLPGLAANGVSGQFVADRLTDEALAFIAAQDERPFFVYLAHFSVHTPIQAPAADREAFAGVEKGVRHRDETYAAMLRNLDANVGRVVRRLEDTPDPRAPDRRLIANTVVVFYSDNGGVGGYRAAGVEGGLEITSQHPLRSGKGSLYEGGIRVPLIVRHDGMVEPGAVCHGPVITVDLYPTLAALAGAALPREQELDGVSLAPVLRGGAELAPRTLFWHFPAYLQASAADGTWRTTPRTALRRGAWKLHYSYETERFELYDLRDPSEAEDLAASRPDLVEELAAEMRRWLVDSAAALPRDRATGAAAAYPGG